MSKRCAKCEKPVYPLEELKCLDKIWHKGCFRCWECNMALNMKTYKGFDKKPYCNAHYPTSKFTAVAETPEMMRLAKNTKMQSQVKYHEEFEKNIKGTKIQVPDDPETQRIKATTAVISQVEYKKLREKQKEMEGMRSKIPNDNDQNEQNSSQPARYDPSRVGGVTMTPNMDVPSPMTAKTQGHSVIYNSKGKVEQDPVRKIGSIHDYDPLNEQHGSLTSGYRPASAMSQSAQWEETTPAPQTQNHAPPQSHVALPSASLPDTQPPSDQSPEPSSQPSDQHYPPPQHNMPAGHQVAAPPQSMPPPQQMAPPQSSPPPQPMAPIQPPPSEPEPAAPAPSAAGLSGPVYQAIYDYKAQDDDEISFVENDLIINCQPIDGGWMYGTCRRTGEHGMLPVNYVERIQ